VLDVVTLPTYRRRVNDAKRGRKPKKEQSAAGSVWGLVKSYYRAAA
jgi:hypothetical protein